MKQIMILAAVCILLTACKKNNEPTDCEQFNLSPERCEKFGLRMYPNETISDTSSNWYTATVEGEQTAVSDKGPLSLIMNVFKFNDLNGSFFWFSTYIYDYNNGNSVSDLLIGTRPITFNFTSPKFKELSGQTLTHYADSIFAVGSKMNPATGTTDWKISCYIAFKPVVKNPQLPPGSGIDASPIDALTITKLEKEDKGNFTNYIIWFDFEAKVRIDGIFVTDLENGKAKFTIPVAK